MFEGIDWAEVVACAPRPEGSWGYLLALAGFVIAARWLAPRRGKSHPSSESVRPAA